MISHKSANVVHFLAYYSLAELNQVNFLCNSNSCNTVSNAADKSELRRNDQTDKEQSWRTGGGGITEVVWLLLAQRMLSLLAHSVTH